MFRKKPSSEDGSLGDRKVTSNGQNRRLSEGFCPSATLGEELRPGLEREVTTLLQSDTWKDKYN